MRVQKSSGFLGSPHLHRFAEFVRDWMKRSNGKEQKVKNKVGPQNKGGHSRGKGPRGKNSFPLVPYSMTSLQEWTVSLLLPRFTLNTWMVVSLVWMMMVLSAGSKMISEGSP